MENLKLLELLAICIVLCGVSQHIIVNSFILKNHENLYKIHENINTIRSIEKSDYINDNDSIGKLNNKKVLSKRETVESPGLEMVTYNYNEDPFDFVFPKDDFYGYQPENINYDIQYVKNNDDKVKIQIKTSFGEEYDNFFNRKNPEPMMSTEKPIEVEPTTMMSTKKPIEVEPTTVKQEVTESPTITTTEKENEIDKEESSTPESITVLDASNRYGINNTVLDKINRTSDTNNQPRKSLIEYIGTLLKQLSKRCEMQCFKMTLNYYSPVCASDRMTYWNEQKLSCVNRCGGRIKKTLNERCPGINMRIIL